MKTFFRATPTRVAHILATETTTRCGLEAGTGARFDASDLPSGERHFAICNKCRKAQEGTGMSKRTDHSNEILEFRTIAKRLEEMYAITGKQQFQQDAVSCTAAADLLEMHDATGINLHQAPGLLDFVREMGSYMIGDITVEDNGV